MDESNRSELRECGYTLIRSVVSSWQCRKWRETADAHPAECHAHSRLMWDIRTRRRALLKVFASFWGTSELIVGFDGIGHRRPGETFELDWHVDQNSLHEEGSEDGCACLQGILALSEMDERTGGTELLRGSHRMHAAIMARSGHEEAEDDWEYYPIAGNDEAFRDCGAVRPTLSPGDLLLWDSRLVHRVVAPSSPTERMVAYVSMTPRRFATEEVLSKRRRAYELGISTTHWPHRFVERGEEAYTRPSWPIPPAVRSIL